jgi:hypothetical protein
LGKGSITLVKVEGREGLTTTIIQFVVGCEVSKARRALEVGSKG